MWLGEKFQTGSRKLRKNAQIAFEIFWDKTQREDLPAARALVQLIVSGEEFKWDQQEVISELESFDDQKIYEGLANFCIAQQDFYHAIDFLKRAIQLAENLSTFKFFAAHSRREEFFSTGRDSPYTLDRIIAFPSTSQQHYYQDEKLQQLSKKLESLGLLQKRYFDRATEDWLVCLSKLPADAGTEKMQQRRKQIQKIQRWQCQRAAEALAAINDADNDLAAELSRMSLELGAETVQSGRS